MKKTLLIAALVVLTISAQAQMWQDQVKIYSTQINTSNYENLAEIAGISSGTITYDHRSHTLTLEDVSWTCGGPDCTYYNFISVLEEGELNVKIVGNVVFNHDKVQRPVFSVDKNAKMNIFGESENRADKINIIHGNGIAADENGEISIKNVTIHADSLIYGIGGLGNKKHAKKYTIENAEIWLSTKYEAFWYVDDVEFIDAEIASPAGAYYDEEKEAVVDENGEIVTGYVENQPTLHIVSTIVSAVDNISNKMRAEKVIENGNIYLIHNGKRYNLLGAEVK